MGKNKHKRFEESKSFKNLFQPTPTEMLYNDFDLKGKWRGEYFKNENPIVVEVGCGKGEFTTGLAKKYPEKNFIGIDFKGARLWRGCKTAIENNLKNVAFIRNKIEFICSFFEENEVDEIWITFPDPQPNKAKKRLTSQRFLTNYAKVLKENSIIHLKTDSILMYEFTQDIIKLNNLENIFHANDLYSTNDNIEAKEIKTYYETKFLAQGLKITYTQFNLAGKKIFEQPVIS